MFKRVVYFTNSFFEGDLFKKGDLIKRVVISRAHGISHRISGNGTSVFFALIH